MLDSVDVMDSVVCMCQFKFSSDMQHVLEGIHKENSNKNEQCLEPIGNCCNNRAL